MGAVLNRKARFGVVPFREAQTSTEGALAFASNAFSSQTSSIQPAPRRFSRVPTHAVGVVSERRNDPRACLALPLRLLGIGDARERMPVTLVTRNISSSGIYFLAPREIEAGTAVELEVSLMERPVGLGNVHMSTAAHIVRCEDIDAPGWRGYAASFDDFAIKRDDGIRLVS
jgi:hypothetical protein